MRLMTNSEASSKRVIGGLLIILILLAFAQFYWFRDYWRPVWLDVKYGPSCTNCNVILISVDTLRADHIGLYENDGSRSISPNIDAFFSEGTTFERAISPSPCTQPAILQFLMGSFDHKSKRPRLAELLKKKNYTTAAFVSQHMCGSAEKPKSAYRVGFDVFDIQSQKELDPYNLTTRNAQVVTDHAIDWAARHASNKKFLLWAHYFDPHDPYFPPKPFVSKTQYRSRVKNGDRRGPLMMAKNQNPRQKELNHVTGELEDEVRDTWRLYGHIFTEAEVAQLEELYRNEITYVDFQIGRLLNALQEQGVLENAIVWLVSDHGERLGEDYTWDHCMSLHAREIHVPLVLSVRGGPILDSRRVTYPVSTLDIVPTTLSLLKHKAAVSFEGKDLLNTGHRGPVFSLWENEAIALDRDVKLYFKNASYKITKVTEPSKETPLADTPDLAEHAPLKKSLDAFVNRQQKTLQSYDELIDKLKALGYID